MAKMSGEFAGQMNKHGGFTANGKPLPNAAAKWYAQDVPNTKFSALAEYPGRICANCQLRTSAENCEDCGLTNEQALLIEQARADQFHSPQGQLDARDDMLERTLREIGRDKYVEQRFIGWREVARGESVPRGSTLASGVPGILPIFDRNSGD
jgi:hypothetical protein